MMIPGFLRWLTVASVLSGGLAPGAAGPPGLSARDGIVCKDGRPYRGVGANYFSLFSRVLKDPDDTTSLAGLGKLAQARVPFVRFMCGGFWPAEQRSHLTDREEFFARLDRVVRHAEREGIGLIPSLFWNPCTVPDLAGEPMDQYGNEGSKTIALVRRYTAEVVKRYRDSPAVWAWEFGNEYNLACDLPNAAEHRPPVWPDLGTAKERGPRDEMRGEHLRVAVTTFARTVREHDKTRLILTGNSVPRASAWHNLHENSWTADTPAQFAAMLLAGNPDPVDTLTAHVYPEPGGVYPGGSKSCGELVAALAGIARESRKPLFLGEFGVARQAGDRARQQEQFGEMLDAIVRERVPLSAFWVFDLAQQDADWNVTFENDRAWMIARVAEANARLARDPAVGGP